MIAEQIAGSSVFAHRIYAKTERGRAEVAQRGASLNAKQRSVLIMVDGLKPCEALTRLMPLEALAPILEELVSLKLIVAAAVARPGPAPLQPAPAPMAAAPAPDQAAAAPAAPPRPARAFDPEKLAQAKFMMIGSAQACLGLLAAEVVRQVEGAMEEDQVLRALAHWHMAMQASKHGRDVAATQLELIKSSLRQAVVAP